jgi:hypothetical protein
MNDILSLSVEYTDTYGGESNYSWERYHPSGRLAQDCYRYAPRKKAGYFRFAR